jgi:hypothetical protein
LRESWPPDDGNKYELVRDDLLVTPSPSGLTRTLAQLSRVLRACVAANALARLPPACGRAV